MRDEILSHQELQALLLRNNMHPALGTPVYELWTNNKPKPMSESDLRESLRRADLLGKPVVDHQRWLRYLNSGKLSCQPVGANKAYIVQRPLKTRDGWRLVDLNAKA